MLWLWLGPLLVLVAAAGGFLLFHRYIVRNYLCYVVRIFQEKPMFIIPFGQPTEETEHVALTTPGGLKLHGCYLPTQQPRRGVILFGLEFGSNCWSCLPYCGFLRDNGFDIFTFEMRGQGQSAAHSGYEPLQWVTEFEVEDFQSALTYLKNRADVDPRGIGFFGLSKGGSAGLIAAALDPFVRCCVTDGAFGCLTTMIPYMKKWITIYSQCEWLSRIIPTWYYRYAAYLGLDLIRKERNCRFVHLEPYLPRLAPRPWLMIHGGADNYIKPEMAQKLFALAKSPKEFWLVEGAKHNQSFQVANGEYQRRVLAFFERHLALPFEAARPTPALESAFAPKESRLVPNP